MNGRSRTRLALAALPAVVLIAAGCSGGDAAETAPLAGSSWSLATYASSDGPSTAAVTGTDGAPLTFAPDGTLAGSTGCNRFTGTYEQDGSSLSITLGGVTQMACEGDLAVQETAVLAALPQVTSFDAAAGLLLTSDNGDVLLTYAAGITDLAGTTWQATGINNDAEAVVSDETTSGVTMAFGDDGTVSGSGGCNTFTGSYSTTDDGQIEFGAIASTLMACDDTLMTTEQQFFAALEQVTTYTIEGTTLNLRDADGATQVNLTLTS